MSTFTPSLAAFRFYANGLETISTPLAIQDANYTMDVAPTGPVFQLRVRIQESGNKNGVATDDWQLQYDRNAATSWANVDASSTYIQAANGTVTDDEATTNRLTGGSGSFVAGKVDEVNGAVEDLQLTGNNFTELLYSIQCQWAALSDGDTLDFRVLYNGSTFTYDVTPRITVNKLLLTQQRFRFYDNDGSESTSTALDTENTNVTINATTAPDFHLRLQYQETSGAAGQGTDDFTLRYSKNSGAYTAITAASANVRADTDSQLTDGGTTTGRLTAGTGSFHAGRQEEGDGEVSNFASQASNYTEHVWALTLIEADLADTNTLDFRLYTAAGTAINAFTVTPRVTVSIPVSDLPVLILPRMMIGAP